MKHIHWRAGRHQPGKNCQVNTYMPQQKGEQSNSRTNMLSVVCSCFPSSSRTCACGTPSVLLPKHKRQSKGVNTNTYTRSNSVCGHGKTLAQSMADLRTAKLTGSFRNAHLIRLLSSVQKEVLYAPPPQLVPLGHSMRQILHVLFGWFATAVKADKAKATRGKLANRQTTAPHYLKTNPIIPPFSLTESSSMFTPSATFWRLSHINVTRRFKDKGWNGEDELM